MGIYSTCLYITRTHAASFSSHRTSYTGCIAPSSHILDSFHRRLGRGGLSRGGDGPFVGVRHVAALPYPDLALLAEGDVFDPDLLGVLLLVGAQVGGVPELGGDAKVLAAAHQGVGLDALDGGGQGVGAEVLVLALGLADEPGAGTGQGQLTARTSEDREKMR